jgi:DNA-binding XRE family transcriptional regulator
MSFQDWKPVILTKMGSAAISKVSATNTSRQDSYTKRARLLDEFNSGTGGSVPKIEKISIEDKKEITQLRILKKMTQEQLNVALNLKKDTIKNIENGTHEKNKALTSKIKAFLMKV